MAIKFDNESFKKSIESRNSKKEFVDNSEQVFTATEIAELSSEIKKKELKKRYNFSLRPSISRTLLIESKRRGITKSELIENLVEQTFNKGDNK